MSDDLNYYVDLIADFERPEAFDEPTGEELANILAIGLPEQGIEVIKVEGIDYCYWVECVAGSSNIELMVGAELLDDEHNRWYIMPCGKSSSFGCKDHPEADYRQLMLAIDLVLKKCDRISDIRWFPNYEEPDYLSLLPHSSGPIRDADYEARLHSLIRLERRIDRITGSIASPSRVFLGFVFACVLVMTMPNYGPYIVTAWFFGFLFLVVVVPIILGARVSKEAKRISSKGDP